MLQSRYVIFIIMLYFSSLHSLNGNPAIRFVAAYRYRFSDIHFLARSHLCPLILHFIR